jgi:hypothetical protein
MAKNDSTVSKTATAANTTEVDLEEFFRKLGQLHALLLLPSLTDRLDELDSDERSSYMALGADLAKECLDISQQLLEGGYVPREVGSVQ